jgi:hypothetical protein
MHSVHILPTNVGFLTEIFGPHLVSSSQNNSFYTSDSDDSAAFFLLFMGVLSLLYLVCALRTNITFVAIFFGLFMTFVLLAGSYWQFALGHGDIALKLQIVSCPDFALKIWTDGQSIRLLERLGSWRASPDGM